jgi:hypothetical protein
LVQVGVVRGKILALGLFLAVFAGGCVETPQESKSARLTIDLVNYSWIGYSTLVEGREGAGAIYSVKVSVENTGTVPLHPEYDVSVSYRGNKISAQTINSSLPPLSPKETKGDDVVLAMVEMDERGSYEVNITLKGEGGLEILDTASKLVNIE